MRGLTVLLWLDLRWTRVVTWRQRRAAELARLTEALPPERVSLLPALEDVRNDWPERLTPTDLVAAYTPRHRSDVVGVIIGHEPAHSTRWDRWTTSDLLALLEIERYEEALV